MSTNFTRQKDFELSTIEIVKPLQGGGYETYNLVEKLVELTIYQDIFNSVLSGKVVLLDSSDILSTIPLTGNEFLRVGIKYPDTSLTGLLDSTLSFAEPIEGLISDLDSLLSKVDFNDIFGGLGSFVGGFLQDFIQANVPALPSIKNLFSTVLGLTDFKRKTQWHLFRIYKADNSQKIGDNAKLETLRLISPEYVWNLQTKFNRNFQKESISSIVAAYFTELKQFFEDTHPEIYAEKLKQDALTIEETSGVFNFASIQANPFNMINGFCNRAISNLDNSTNFVFFQNNVGFNFRSLASIFSQQNSLQFFCKNPNIAEDKQQAFSLNALAFEALNRLQSFDTINNLREGLYGSRLLSVDPLRKKWYKKDYKLSEEFFKYISSSGNAGDSQLQIESNYEGMDQINARQMLLLSSKGHDTEPYLKALDPSLVDHQVESVAQLRTSQLQLLQQAKTYIRVPGHPSINAGLKCSFNMPNFSVLDVIAKNKYLQGSYVITACAHHISTTKYDIEAELVKSDFYSKINFGG